MLERYYQASRKYQSVIFLVSAIIIAVGLKLWLLLIEAVPFNSDEAVVALMARHITQGEAPIFFYGQAYMGSLDAWLVAGGFWIFGESVWVIRLVQGLLYVGVLISTVKLGEVALGSKRAGILAAWFLAIPPVVVSLYTTVSLGGYGEALLLGNLILLEGIFLIEALRNDRAIPGWRWCLWGGMVGLGIWAFGLTLVYSIPVGIALLVNLGAGKKFVGTLRSSKTWQAIFLMLLGGLIGSAPWWMYASQYGFQQLLWELSGGAIAGVENTHWLLRTWNHFWTFFLFGGTVIFGLRPSWEIRWLAMPLLPVAMTFWTGVVVHTFTRLQAGRSHRRGAGLLIGVIVVLAFGFIFTPFGADPSGRYFLPLAIPLSLFAAEMIILWIKEYGRWVWGFVGLILAFNLWGAIQSAAQYPPGITTQFDEITQVDHRYMDELIDFLDEQDIRHGYTNYWVAYPLAFQSAEELIFIPRLPYHGDFRYTSRDDRYEPYHDLVAGGDRIAYITTHHPDLDGCLREHFDNLEVVFDETYIGDYNIFYDLSWAVRPEEMGFDGDLKGVDCSGWVKIEDEAEQ
ncbi:MAG: hypothetical protein ISS57_04820 [Anaerolineales bacterium]|nr:hypothetical protein [Chloroflexota bacterium]MBL7161908.1 hypothetical protein [Anaerolineales bacterium]